MTYQAGFANLQIHLTYFSRSFKKQYGKLPGKYAQEA
jgi:AraC-like DNA-binding protein